MRDEIEFAGATSYSTGGWTERFGELARVEQILIQPDNGTLDAGGGSARAMRVAAASPDPNQVTIQVFETTAGGTGPGEISAGEDLSDITFYGMAEGT